MNRTEFLGPIVKRYAALALAAAGPHAADAIGRMKPGSQLAAACGPQTFFGALAQHVRVEREVGHEPFQPRVLILDRPELAQFADARCAYYFFQMSKVASLTLSCRHTSAGAVPPRLTQGVGDLCLGELRALQRFPLLRRRPSKPRAYSSSQLSSFSGETSSRPTVIPQLTESARMYFGVISLSYLSTPFPISDSRG